MNKFQSKYEVLTPNGWMDFDGIKKTSSSSTIEIETSCGNKLTCTSNHRISTDVGFVCAQDLRVGDFIHTGRGNEVVAGIIYSDAQIDVYDLLDVKGGNVYFTNGVVSHNCEFLGSSGTLISGERLKALKDIRPVAQTESVKQYIPPIDGHIYALIADVSRGKGLDYSAFTIFDVTEMPYKQVCIFRDNTVGPGDYASIIHRFGKLYNEAHILIEINDNGGQVADTLFFEFGYENMLFTEHGGRSGKRISGGFGKGVDRGIKTSKSVKSIGCSLLKLLIEQQQLIVYDSDTIEELKHFSKKANSYEAESGWHDDMVMTLVLFSWLTDQNYFKDVTDINTLMTLRQLSEEQIDEDLLPFGFILNGNDTKSTMFTDAQGDVWMEV